MTDLLVTGGAGFIGSNFVHHIVKHTDHHVTVLDKLTYAGNRASLAGLPESRVTFIQGDITDAALVDDLFGRVDSVVHYAAESHNDNSLNDPRPFLDTNIIGTYTLLEAARRHDRRFHHISTDEVYGSLGEEGLFTETTAYDPRSPYSASKAASDHLVRAWGHTYGLPVLVTNCSNNYGPYHFPEKLIPLIIIRALAGEPLPVYGDGSNVRDWLFVEDHARALRRVFEAGVPGETYNIGGNSERRNIEVVRAICAALDARRPRGDGKSYAEQITFVADRPGHDQRYAIDAAKIARELGWEPQVRFEDGIAQTVDWYLARADWWEPILQRRYATERLGLKS